MQIVEAIAKKIKEKGISVLKLSKETDIPATRLYKWFDGKAKPKYEDITKLEKWLNELELIPHESHQVGNSDGAGNKIQIEHKVLSAADEYKDKYIQMLERQNEFLLNAVKEMQSILETLKEDHRKLEKNQHTMMAQLMAASRMAAIRSAGRDKKKFEEEVRTLDKLIGEFS